MKLRSFYFLLIALLCFGFVKNSRYRRKYKNPMKYSHGNHKSHDLTPRERAEELAKKMDLASKFTLVRGYPGDYVGNVYALPEFKIPQLNLEDGPQGVADKVTKVTCWPNALSIVSTFNRDVMEQYAAALAEEQRLKGTNIMLGPMVNLARVPFGGRNFESFGEDPYLASEMVIRNVRGIQKKGVMGCVKHYVDNNQEDNRTGVSAKVDDRTQHELYYKPFLAAIKEGVGSAMCGYNLVNGTYDCENAEIQNDAMKDWMGFEGFIMSDWGATHSTVASANNGLDMEMPRGDYFGQKLQDAVKAGDVSEERIHDMVVRILTPLFAIGIMDTPQTGNITDNAQSKEHTELAQKFAELSTVLVKNDKILPLDTSKIKRIAVIGNDGMIDPKVTGGGSGHVKCTYVRTPYEGISDYVKNTSIEVKYATTVPYDQAAKVAKESDIAIVFVSTDSSEGSDRPTLGLGVVQDTLIESVVKAQSNTIVVVHNPAAVLMPWISKVKAALVGWYSGQMAGDAIASILFGDSNPSAKLPITFPINDSQHPLKQKIQYPGVDGKTEYTEGLFIGYRWYDLNKEVPLFPFGHGLSYSKFTYGDLHFSSKELKKGEKIEISLNLKNEEGMNNGREVVQLYLSFPELADKPPKILADFKDIVLDVGKSGEVEFIIEMDENISVWDTVVSDWKVVPGEYQVLVGSSSRDIRSTGSFTVVE